MENKTHIACVLLALSNLVNVKI